MSDASRSAIDSHRSAASLSDCPAELGAETHKPVLKRLDKILGSQALNNLCLREPVSQSLTLGIDHDGSRLEKDGDDIRSWKKKESVPPYGTKTTGGRSRC